MADLFPAQSEKRRKGGKEMTPKDSGNPSTFGQSVLRTVKHVFLHNGWFKLLAVGISIFLWAGLISQDASLTRDKVFNDIPITITGQEALNQRGYIVTSDIKALLENVTAIAAVPQQQYEAADISAYNPRIDVNRITGVGEQKVFIQSNSSALYGKLSSINPASINVEVQEFTTRYSIPVSSPSDLDKDVPGNWYLKVTTVDPNMLTVSGPKEIVNTISRARTILDTEQIEWQEGTNVYTGRLILLDRSQNEIENPYVSVRANVDNKILDHINLECTVYPKKNYEIADAFEVVNSPASGYEFKGIRVSPESIFMAGTQDILETTEPIFTENTIDLTGLKGTTTYQFRVTKPNDRVILSTETVTVTVEIAPVSSDK